MQDFEFNIEQFIALMEEKPVLWDRHSENYKNRNLTMVAWKEICAAVRDDYESMDETNKNELSKFSLVDFHYVSIKK